MVPAGHDIKRVYEQVDEHSSDALTVQDDHQVFRDTLNDLHRLSFGNKNHFVHRAGYQLLKIGPFYASVRPSVTRQDFVEQFPHADRSAVQIACNSVDL
jgi:hypothetical protein